MEPRSPITPNEFQSYYLLRYEVLRKPWNQPPGSEKDSEENAAIHAAIFDKGTAIACGRLQFTDEHTGQVRFMAVSHAQQGKGLGKKILDYLEHRSFEAGRNRIILHARENALAFYKACGYTIIEKSHLLWGQVQHWLMEKKLQ